VVAAAAFVTAVFDTISTLQPHFDHRVNHAVVT